MDVTGERISEVVQLVGDKHRSLCSCLERPASDVRFVASSTGSVGSECLFSQLDRSSGLCVSTVCPYSSLPGEAQTGTSGPGSCLPPLALSGLVSAPVADVGGLSSRSLVGFTSGPLPDSRSPSSSAVRQIPSDRLEVVRRRFKDRGLSEDVITLLLGHNRDTTSATYQSAWNGWVDWNDKRDSDPLLPSLNIVLQYLTDLFNSGLAYSTINIHRSMLSSTLGPVEGNKIGEHPLVIQLLKGCFNLKPPQPRYKSLWDPDVVLRYFDSLGANVTLSLVALSRKLAILLALATVARVSEICSISFSSIKFSLTAVTFSFSKLKKAQKSGPLQSCVLSRFDGLCCPVACLESYIAATTDWRVANSDSLFLSVKQPHTPVGSSTLGRWIKLCLSDAGLDPGAFSAHSTRGAAASKAVKQGVPIESVLLSANWSKESTFRRFYLRELEPVPLATVVLTQTSFD